MQKEVLDEWSAIRKLSRNCASPGKFAGLTPVITRLPDKFIPLPTGEAQTMITGYLNVRNTSN
jgi:hypothetical protein